jgi:predicted Co/Zn/Cd cation transporter (cation efflux family)
VLYVNINICIYHIVLKNINILKIYLYNINIYFGLDLGEFHICFDNIYTLFIAHYVTLTIRT